MSRLNVLFNGEVFSCRLPQCKASVMISNKEEGGLRILFGGINEESKQVVWLVSRHSPSDHIKIQIVEDDGITSESVNLDNMYLSDYYALKKKLEQ